MGVDELHRRFEQLRLGHEAHLAADVAAHQEVVHEREVVGREDHGAAAGHLLDGDRAGAQERVGVQRGEHARELVRPVGFARARALVEAVEVLLGPRVGVDLLAHRGEIAHQTLYVRRGARLRAGPARASMTVRARRVHAHEVEQLAGAMDEAGGRAPAGAVGEVELELDEAVARRGRRRSSCRSPCRSRRRTAARRRARRSLSARCPEIGARGPQAAAAADRPAREAEREPDAAADARGEGGRRRRPRRRARRCRRARASARAESPRSPSQRTNTDC